MPPSKVQLAIWKAREEIDRKLSKMTPQEQLEYFNGAMERFKAATGVELHLRTITKTPEKAGR